MVQPEDDQTEEKPLDPAVERVRRKLVRFIAINLGILLLALMAVVAALVYRATRVERQSASPAELQAPSGAAVYGEIALPPGARIAGHTLSGNRLSLYVELAGGAHSILIYNMAEGRMVGRFDVREER